jgi:hypothetical protein
LAVRQLKGYASWVQTVEKRREQIMGNRFFNRLNPEVIKTSTRRFSIVI